MKRILSLALVCVLLLGCVFALASCGGPNKDPEKAAKALEDAGYEVDCDVLDEATKDGIYAYVEAYLGDPEELDDDEKFNFIEIYYFEDAESAKEAFKDEEMQEYFEEFKEEVEDDFDVEVIIEQSGKMIYIGTKAAIKAAK